MGLIGENYNGEEVYPLKRRKMILRSRNSVEFNVPPRYVNKIYVVMDKQPSEFSSLKTFTSLSRALKEISFNTYLVVFKCLKDVMMTIKKSGEVYESNDPVFLDHWDEKAKKSRKTKSIYDHENPIDIDATHMTIKLNKDVAKPYAIIDLKRM